MSVAFAGLRGTGSWGPDERPKNFREYILWANPNGSAPIFALTSKMSSEKTDDPEFNWWEETLTAVRVRVNFTTGYTSSDTTIVIAGGGLALVPGDVLQIEKTETAVYDAEIVEVSSVTNDTTIVIKRGRAGSTAQPLAHNTWMTRIGSAYEEGSRSPNVALANPVKFRNYCQIFKTAVGQTETAQRTRTRSGNNWKTDIKRKLFHHSVGIEFALLFGRAYEDTSGTFPKRYTGGLRSFITSNVTIFTTTPTEDAFLNAVYKVFDIDAGGAGDERLVFCGNEFLNSLNKLARSSPSTRIIFNRTIELYGMRMNEYILPQGRLAFRTHPLFNQHGKYTTYAFIINPAGLTYRYLRDTKFYDNIQLPDEDVRKAQWLTECGLEVNFERTFGIIGNFVV